MSDHDYISSQISHTRAPEADRTLVQRQQQRSNRLTGSAGAVNTRPAAVIPSRLRQQGVTLSDTGLLVEV